MAAIAAILTYTIASADLLRSAKTLYTQLKRKFSWALISFFALIYGMAEDIDFKQIPVTATKSIE